LPLRQPAPRNRSRPATHFVAALRVRLREVDIPDVTPYGLKKEEMATNVMSVPCFLVAHPKGTLMWDVRRGSRRRDSRRRHWNPSASMARPPSPLRSSDGGGRYSPADITYLAISHFHWDHVGNANMFAGATWLAASSSAMSCSPTRQARAPSRPISAR